MNTPLRGVFNIRAPAPYIVRSFILRDVIDWEYDIRLIREEERWYRIKESDTALFRMVRRITDDERKYNPYIVFVDCGGVSDYADAAHQAGPHNR